MTSKIDGKDPFGDGIPRLWICDECDFRSDNMNLADCHQVDTDHSMTRCKNLK